MAAFALATIVVAALPGAQGDEQPAPAKSPNPVKNTVGRISGAVVRDQGGDPLAGAEVTLLLPAPPGRDYYVWPLPLRQAKTDAQGRFSFENLPPGKYRVWANHEKLTSRRETLRGERVVIPEEGDPPKPLELRMFPGVGVTATVKAQSTGAVIPGAIVHFGWSDFKDDNFATDDRGRVSLQPLAPQRWFIEAWADGFARKSQWLNLESGSDAEVEFLLGPGGNIDGVVRDPAGKAVAGVGISVRTEEDSRQLTYTRTDEEGRYRLNHLPLGSRLELYLSKLDYLRETTTAWANGPKQSLDLTIHPRPHGGSIAGAVFDQEGRPIAGAVLTNMGRSSDEICKATTDKEGKFKLENLYEGAHGREVTVRAKTFAPLRLTVKPGPADKPAEMDIALDAGHTLKGRVEDEAGKPLEGVTVYFAGGGNPFSDGDKTRTDQQGLFEFDSLPPECPFTFFKPGYSRIDRRELQIDSPDVIAVKLLPSGVIRGKVLDATTNKPIRTFRIRITFSPQRQPGDPTDGIASELVNPGQAFQSEQGLFKIGELLLGMPLQVMVDSEGYERGVLERVVAERADRLETG
jgi:uncharacterized GH25 family protein